MSLSLILILVKTLIVLFSFNVHGVVAGLCAFLESVDDEKI
jgi:hypothetical protein